MEAFIGTICPFGFSFAPYQWALCQGQLLSIAQNTALFSLLGINFGGNGTNSFGLPNLMGRVANCQGTLQSGGTYVMGQTGGAESVTVLYGNLPAHSHTVNFALNANSASVSTPNPSGAYPGTGADKPYNAAPASPAVNMHAPTVTLGNTGGSTPIAISDPSLVMNYCISLYGIFPARN